MERRRAGVIEATVDAMRALGARELSAWLGPCIHAECYEFGEADLDETSWRGTAQRCEAAPPRGARALDLPMAVAAALGGVGVALVESPTSAPPATKSRFYSHRARQATRVAMRWRCGSSRATDDAASMTTSSTPRKSRPRVVADARARMARAGGAGVRLVAVTKAFPVDAVSGRAGGGRG